MVIDLNANPEAALTLQAGDQAIVQGVACTVKLGAQGDIWLTTNDSRTAEFHEQFKSMPSEVVTLMYHHYIKHPRINGDATFTREQLRDALVANVVFIA